MSEKSALRVTELDFESIRNNLKTYLRSQAEFQDFDFEGSGMAVLLDILAYNTHYMGFYLNMVGNEMFLDTAQIRQSILSHAKAINYIPASKKGAEAKINIRVTPVPQTEDDGRNTLTLQKYTKFLGTDIQGVNYPFVTLDSNTAFRNSNSFYFSNVHIKQGEVITRQFFMEPTNESRRFEIPSANVDTSSITIIVADSAASTNVSTYTLAEDITEVTSESKVYFMEENEKLNYTFYFGDNIIGKRPVDGSVITCTYLDTIGALSNNINRFVLVDPIGAEVSPVVKPGFRDNVRISSVGGSYGARDKESIEQVRFRAPYFYTTQNRAVTRNDYETLMLKDYPNVEAVSVWGGEDNDPVVYGKVYLSLKTRGNFILTNVDKENIKNDLIRRKNVVTITPEIVDPDYTYILLRGKINYNPTITSRSPGELVNLAKAAISDYVDNELNTFKSTFRKSKIQAAIEAADPAILGSDLTIYIQKRVTLDPTRIKSYDVRYNLSLRKGDYNISLYTTPQVTTYDYNGVIRQIYFEEKPLSATGIDSIIVINPGFNYFNKPTVTISGDGAGAIAEADVRNGRINSINILNRGSNYTRAEIAITAEDGSEAEAIARLESRFGIIRSYFFKETGEKVILNENAGTVDYETGLVTINSFIALGTANNQFYDTNVVTFNFPVEKEIILPLRNRILTIDENDPLAIQIEAVAET